MRASSTVEPPDLRAEGFQLLGARLAYFLDRVVAEMGYQRNGHRLSIFLTKGDGELPLVGERLSMGGKEFSIGTSKGYTVVAWRESQANVVCSVVGDLGREQLLPLALKVPASNPEPSVGYPRDRGRPGKAKGKNQKAKGKIKRQKKEWIMPWRARLAMRMLGSLAVLVVAGGRGWANHVHMPEGPFGGIVLGVLADRAAPQGLYAVVFGGGIFKSINAGQVWTGINTGLENPSVFCLVQDPSAPSVLYVGTDAGVFKTTSGGA